MVAYMAHSGSLWAAPTIYGLAASALLMIAVVCVKVVGRPPAKRPVVDSGSIEQVLRSWLDNFRAGVKNDPGPDVYFRYIVTVDSGAKIVVARSNKALSATSFSKLN